MTKEEAARPTQGLDLRLRQPDVCHDLLVPWASGPAQSPGREHAAVGIQKAGVMWSPGEQTTAAASRIT